jgi:hypothetical protein
MTDPIDPAGPETSRSLAAAPGATAPEADHSDKEVEVDRTGKPALKREQLYERLGLVDDPEEAEEAPAVDPQVDDADEKPADAEEAPASEDAADAEEDPEAETAEEAPAAEEKPAAEKAPNYLGRVPDTEWARIPKATRDRINALRAEHKKVATEVATLKSRDHLAAYGESVLSFADKAKMRDEDLATWLEVGAVVNAGGEPAVSELLAMARRLGWNGDSDAPAAHAPTSRQAPLPDWLQAQVDAAEMTEEAAHRVAQRIAAAPTSPTPTGKEEPPARPKAPRFGPAPEILAEGKKAMAERIGAAEGRFGSQWAKLWPSVQREMLKHKGSHPSAWGPIFDQAVELVVERSKAKPKPLQPSLEPSRGGKPVGKGEKLSPRERLYKFGRSK